MATDYHWHIESEDGLTVLETDEVKLDRANDHILAMHLDCETQDALGQRTSERATVQWLKRDRSEFRILMQDNRVVLMHEVRGCYDRRCRQKFHQFWIDA